MSDQADNNAVEDPNAALMDALGDDAPPPELEEDDPPAEDPAPEEEPEQPAVSQKFRVKVKNDEGADEERDLSLEELAAGYMQSADYTRKTQAAAAHEKARQEEYFQAVHQTTQQARQQLAALQAMVVQAAAPELQNVNWTQLAASDPAQYVQLQAKQQQLSQVLGTIQAENQRLEQHQQALIEQQREQARAHSLDYLNKKLPGVNLKAVAPKLVETAGEYGYSEAEIRSVVDGRALHLLHDAMQWRALQSAKPKALQKVVDAPKVIKPSAPQPKNRGGELTKRLQQTGRVEDLAAFL